MAEKRISVSCCIAGGGSAGMMLGFLLARAGVEVLVLGHYQPWKSEVISGRCCK